MGFADDWRFYNLTNNLHQRGARSVVVLLCPGYNPRSPLQERDRSTLRTHVLTHNSLCCPLFVVCRFQNAKGLAGHAGYILSLYELERRKFHYTLHEGAIQLVLVTICIISVLLVYGWICALTNWVRDPGHAKVRPMLSARIRALTLLVEAIALVPLPTAQLL